ncbi:hypothetical protein pb186bvf_008187 [Paramecium bursaria]
MIVFRKLIDLFYQIAKSQKNISFNQSDDLHFIVLLFDYIKVIYNSIIFQI